MSKTGIAPKRIMRLWRISWVALWVAWPVIVITTFVARTHPSLFLSVVQDCALVIGNLALLGLCYYTWRRWRIGPPFHREPPNESQISRLLASRRGRHSG
jgi:Mn2+/Fe2+ NRAMP family transporter